MLRAERMLSRPDAPPFDRVVRRVTGLVAQKWPRIEALADQLVQYRRLDHAKVCRIVGR